MFGRLAMGFVRMDRAHARGNPAKMTVWKPGLGGGYGREISVERDGPWPESACRTRARASEQDSLCWPPYHGASSEALGQGLAREAMGAWEVDHLAPRSECHPRGRVQGNKGRDHEESEGTD